MDKLKIPERFKGILYVYTYNDPTHSLHGRVLFSDHDVSNWSEVVVLAEVPLDIPLNSEASLDNQRAFLRAKQQRLIEDSALKVKELEEAINSLYTQ